MPPRPAPAVSRLRVHYLAKHPRFSGISPLVEGEAGEGPALFTLAQVHAALAYYFDNHDEVEAELRADDEFILRMAGRYAPHLASA